MGPRPGGCTRSSLSPSLAHMSTARQELKLRNRTTKVSRRRAKAGGSRCWARQPACVQPRRSLRPSYSPSPKGESFASCRASPAGCRSQTRGATKAAGLPTPPLWRWTERPRSNSRPALRHNKIPVPRRDGKKLRALRRNGGSPIRRCSVAAAMLDRRPMRAPRARRLGCGAGGCPGRLKWERLRQPSSSRIGRAVGGAAEAASSSSIGEPGRTRLPVLHAGGGLRRTSRRVRTRRYPSPGK